jgi:transposase
MKRGKPTKLNLKLQEAICKHIASGMYPSKAAILEGLGERTYYTWMQRGREEKQGKYKHFQQAVKKAESVAETVYLEQIRKASTGEETGNPVWQAAAWYLERRYPDEWGRRERVDVNQSTEINHHVKIDIFAEIKKLEATLKNRKKSKIIEMKKD